jgi:polar amino acid transport system substrate-binding protein
MRKLLIGMVGLAMIGVACGSTDNNTGAGATTVSPAPSASASADPCAAESLNLLTPGTLTIGTDNPAFQPWFGGTGTYGTWKAKPGSGTGNPASGEGFESAVAYAIADRLGFTNDQVTWVPVTFNESFKPGDKAFDFDINEISYSSDRAQAVDFSESYYDVAPALVALKGTPIAQATTFADLKGYTLGAQIGTTSYTYIVNNIRPDRQPAVFDRSVDVIRALSNGQIDGYLTDAPTAYVNVLIGQVQNGVVVGQLPAIGDQEYFGLVFAKGNPLVDCVNRAIEALKSDGTLDRLEAQWLKDVTFPEIRQ